MVLVHEIKSIDEGLEIKETNKNTKFCIVLYGQDKELLEALFGYSIPIMDKISPMQYKGQHILVRDYTKVDKTVKIFLVDENGRYIQEPLKGLQFLSKVLQKDLNNVELEVELREPLYEVKVDLTNEQIIHMMELLKFNTTSENGEYQRTDKYGRYVVSLYDNDNDGNIEFIITDTNKVAESNIDKIESMLKKEIIALEKKGFSRDEGTITIVTENRDSINKLYDKIYKMNPNYSLYSNVVGSVSRAMSITISKFKRDKNISGFMIEGITESSYLLHYKNISKGDMVKVSKFIKAVK